MSDLFPYVAMAVSFTSGAWTAWILTSARRPKRIECPNCVGLVLATQTRDHWKRCI